MRRDGEARSLLESRYSVSRETMARLDRFTAVLEAWNARLNLVSSQSIGHAWDRHILDSAQVLDPVRSRQQVRWADIGSGAGFPGLIVAILGSELIPGLDVTLFESNARKCAFLANVSRETSTPVRIVNARVEGVDPVDPGDSRSDSDNFDVVSARAVAELPELLRLAAGMLADGGVCLFPKGRSCDSEIRVARENWKFALTQWPSLTDPDARILEIGDIVRVTST